MAIVRGAPRLRSLCLRSVSLVDEDGTKGTGLSGLLDGTTPVAIAGGAATTAASISPLISSPPPLAGLTSLAIEYALVVGASRLQRTDQFNGEEMHRAADGPAPDPPEAIARVLLELARRGACPRLRSLRLTVPPGRRCYSRSSGLKCSEEDRACALPRAFAAGAPWPSLVALSLSGVASSHVAAAVGELEAPLLASLVLWPAVCRGGLVDAARLRAVRGAAAAGGAAGGLQQQQQAPAEWTVYEAIRERSPLLPELKANEAAEAKGAGLAAAATEDSSEEPEAASGTAAWRCWRRGCC